MAQELELGEQFALPGLSPKLSSPTPGAVPDAADNPVARVYVEKVPLHLDHTFDYLVPENLSAGAVPGARVKVPFGGQTLNGYVFSREPRSTHPGRLARIKAVVSHLPVVHEQTFELCALVAHYYAGTMTDTLRLAVPPRAAKIEKEFQLASVAPVTAAESAYGELGGQPTTVAPAPPPLGHWDPYGAGPAFLEHIAQGGSPRAVWTALPGLAEARPQTESGEPGAGDYERWTLAVIEAITAARSAGRSALIVLPTTREVDRFADVLNAHGFSQFTSQNMPDPKISRPIVRADYVRLTNDMGTAPRYRSYLAALTGQVSIVVGTRGAAFAPVKNLGLAVCWDDANESHQDRHAPYSHAREVLALRSEQFGAALLIGGHGRSVHGQGLIQSGWAHELRADRSAIRQCAPRVFAYGDQEMAQDGRAAQGRLPSRVWTQISKELVRGPVLITVPRAGYIPMVACSRCRDGAHCESCHGPLSLTGATAVPQCLWCGSLAGNWSCGTCHGTTLRAMRVGSDRTAEELGRAFPNVPVRVSGAKSVDGILETVQAKPALVIATPGAEPRVSGGYGLGVILDAQVGSAGTGLYTDQETLDRWLATASLVRGQARGGQVFLVGQGSALPTAALVRWDPIGMAQRELAQRFDLAMPPAWRVASVTGDRLAVSQFLDALELPAQGSVLGPVEVQDTGRQAGWVRAEDRVPLSAQGGMTAPVRAIIRVPVGQGRELAKSVRAMQSIASARRSAALVNVVLDPKELL